MSKTHYLVHVHPNNACGIRINNIKLPTYLNVHL